MRCKLVRTTWSICVDGGAVPVDSQPRFPDLSRLSLAAQTTSDLERGREHRWSAPLDERPMLPAPVLIAHRECREGEPDLPKRLPGPGRSPGCMSTERRWDAA